MAVKAKAKAMNKRRSRRGQSAALQLALNFLGSDVVQQQLKAAPAAVVKWANERREQRAAGRTQSLPSKLNPAARFGQRGLERRVAKLSDAISLVFGDRATSERPELWDAVDELKTAVTVAAGLPVVKRKRMHMRIDNDLDELETGLIEALSPKR